jgi:Flp pilus assembly protein TadD
MPAQFSATKRKNLRRHTLLTAALMVLGLGLIAFLRSFTRPAPPIASLPPALADPRLTYDGPYRNISPDVHYVGDVQCAGCHDDILQSYAHHPMGRSLAPVESLLEQLRYTPDASNPFHILGRRFEVVRQGKRLWHRQAVLEDSGKPVAELSLEVQWIIGSGAKGYSYLFERDGYLFQTPISWFSHQQRWDLSPGFGPTVFTGRLVGATCLFCHVNRVQEHPQQPNRFVPLTGETSIPLGKATDEMPVPSIHLQAIGCERCHGPGERHIESADRWDIVNPARLPPQLRDAVCEQCHLEGEARVLRAGRKLFDFRPGLPLSDFWAVLVQDHKSGEDTKAVNHVEQMYESKCFSKAVDGVKLGCITCHDPHVHIGPAQRQTYYRPKCLLCHDGAKGPPVCSEPHTRRSQVSPQDNCIDCHMPRYHSWDVAHTATTDHRILRRPQKERGVAPFGRPNLDNAVLVDFYRDRFPNGDPQTERNLGLGLLKLIRMNMLQSPRHAERALRLLEIALGRDPSDGSVRQGKVEAYLLLNRPVEALSEAEVLLPQQPENGELLVQAAYAAQGSGQGDRALAYWRRAVKINPFLADDQLQLMQLLLRTEQWDEAQRHCEELLRLDPFNVSGWQARIGFLLRQGQRAEAQRTFDVIRKLNPPDLARREEWFRQMLR